MGEVGVVGGKMRFERWLRMRKEGLELVVGFGGDLDGKDRAGKSEREMRDVVGFSAILKRPRIEAPVELEPVKVPIWRMWPSRKLSQPRRLRASRVGRRAIVLPRGLAAVISVMRSMSCSPGVSVM